MKRSISFRNIEENDVGEDYIDRRLSFAFSHIQHAIESTLITIHDVNGPKGGSDKLCKVVVKPKRLPSVVIVDQQASLKLAIDRSISRASQNLSRRLKRMRDSVKTKKAYKRNLAEEEHDNSEVSSSI